MPGWQLHSVRDIIYVSNLSLESPLMKLHPKLQPILFGLILSGFMSALVSGVTLLRTTGLVDGFGGYWLNAWVWAWAVAFPAVLVFAPIARRIVARLFANQS